MRSSVRVIVCAACSAAASAQTSSLSATQVAEILDPQPSSSNRFGRDILLDGDTALVMYGIFTSSYGVKCVVDTGASWMAAPSPNFTANGYTMSFEGDLFLQGYPYGPNDRVAVWRRNGAAWTQTWEDNPDVGPTAETFGETTDIDGTTVVIGNQWHTEAFTEEGALYVYEDTGSSLVLRQTLYGGAAGTHLGVQVRASGDDMLVYYRGSNAPVQFGIRAFRRVAGTWTLSQANVAPIGQLNGGIVLDRGLAVARKAGGGFFVLANAGAGWFVDTDVDPGPGFAGGLEYALSDGVIAVGDPSGGATGVDQGEANLFARNGGWKLQATVTAANPADGDYFGYGLQIQGDRLMVGAPNHDQLGQDTGAVYEFQLTHSPARVHCVPERTSSGCVAHMGFSGTPSASSSQPFLVTATGVSSHRNGVLVYGTNGPIFLTYPGGVRCVAPPRRTTARQPSGGTPNVDDCTGSLSVDFNAFVQSGVDAALVAGQRVDAQWIFRDPLGPSALASSEAVAFVIGP